MVINENNSHINSFTKGMNSDAAYDQIQNSQYTFGQNIRITKNQSLGRVTGDFSSLHEGIIAPVPVGINSNRNGSFNCIDFDPEEKILAVDSIDNICIIVTKLLEPYTKNNKEYYHVQLRVHRIIIDEIENTVQKLSRRSNSVMWEVKNFWDTYEDEVPDQISIVLYKELENVIKLYIATGKTPIITLRVDDEGYTNNSTNVDDVINNRIVPRSRVYIDRVISGRLRTSQVQYTYRYYNKYGNTTQLAPLTNKIQIIDPSRSKEVGNAEDTETSIGLSLKINTTEYHGFDRMQVYRLSYIKPRESAEVALIYDDKIPSTNEFVLNDIGIEPLQKLTMDEFAAMSGLILVPQVIEQNQEYMFCGNVKDDTIIKGLELKDYYSETGWYKLIHADIILAENSNGRIPQLPANAPITQLPVNDPITRSNILSYIKQRMVNPEAVQATYNNIFTSSLLRSLRRGETYKYGIVYYDKYGRRSDVQKLGTIDTFEMDEDPTFKVEDGILYARPIGVQINLPQIQGNDINPEDIIGCQVVRRSSSNVYQKTLLQVALARPLQQGLVESPHNSPQGEHDATKQSPFYPSGFLTTNDFVIKSHYYWDLISGDGDNYYNTSTGQFIDNFYRVGGQYVNTHNEQLYATTKNTKLYQIFSSEIDFHRDDILSELNVSTAKIKEVSYLYGDFIKYIAGTEKENEFNGLSSTANATMINRLTVDKLSMADKQDIYYVFNFFNSVGAPSGFSNTKIKSIKDVKIPHWNSGFENVQFKENGRVYDAIKKYRGYTTTIGEFKYNNWASFGKYDLRPGTAAQPNNSQTESGYLSELIAPTDEYNIWLNTKWPSNRDGNKPGEMYLRNGFIGPGPSCFLLSTEDETIKDNTESFNGSDKLYTSICNIYRDTIQDGVISDEQEMYYGFGNYFELKYQDNELKVIYGSNKDGSDKVSDKLIVFDGDIYITPHEFTTVYKAYDFNSVDTLQSIQITNYVPLESKVNTYFDYGMNLMNTDSANLMYEPGAIDGVTSQERPAHQYNLVYSDNDTSNDVFTLISTDKNETNQFKQRAYYSELKTNGEFVDNFLIFKPAAFIDVDSKYGEITEMLTDKNQLYYWQDHAFGRFSVNERSLVNDQNGNTIMLGQAGILSRYDYASTKYGMRPQDFCARSTEQGIYWVDINNKAVVAGNSEQVVNYGEQLGVQNLINSRLTSDIPKVDYDLQNNELLCKCFGNDQLVFNIKYGMATSIYTRRYDWITYIKNHIFGIEGEQLIKFNYLNETENTKYLLPVELEFVVNHSASITKVFDNQQIIPIKRNQYLGDSFNKLQMAFETDLYSTDAKPELYTDREGNILYAIPRFDNQAYGSRLRGKWMKVKFTNDDESLSDNFTISHVITKFRQSFS